MNLEAKPDKLEAWAIVELFGHTRIAGHVSEFVVGGMSFVRVDVPEVGDVQGFTKLYGPSAIYSITFVDEETAVHVTEVTAPQPITIYKLQTQRRLSDGHNDDYDSDEDVPW